MEVGARSYKFMGTFAVDAFYFTYGSGFNVLKSSVPFDFVDYEEGFAVVDLFGIIPSLDRQLVALDCR